MIVAGVMSGTSADGINVALVRLLGRGFRTRLELLQHAGFPYPPAVRRTILSFMNAQAGVGDLARLNFLLGELYGEAILSTSRKARTTVDLVGCHGQTLYHQGEAASFLGRRVAVTWQTGEAAVVAARVGVPVVADFRPADMAAGGKGAPLVPFLDYILYRHRRRGRILQNIGGIANLTAIPRHATPEEVIAFDTGPGNMVIDSVTDRLFGKAFDRNGRIASKGRVLERVVDEVLARPYFRRRPPKTAGREEFGREFASMFVKLCGRAAKEDVVATATALTAESIAFSVRTFLPGMKLTNRRRLPYRDFIVSGGGSKNPTLMHMIAETLPGLRMQTTDDYGLPSEAKEAVAFALLAYQTWRRMPSNIPSATGAKRPAVLGKVAWP
ncbi:MAG TPA: anhydro-N-acetylmuramic acid kinase [Terriglobales bacterium]|nr:anhydro-N-acetylmuramic acid kinase [Terriglobales bacterium]